MLTRLRIGHTALTHSYLLKGEPPQICQACDPHITVKHILIECKNYQNERKISNLPNALQEILRERCQSSALFKYLKPGK